MKKEAKSPPDAVQQKLRDHKKKWNPIVSDFINDLIHFKKLMNGSPNKFHQQKGDIKYPIPADPSTIIGVLANDFNEIAQEANKIVSEQMEFSRNRRKRQSQNMKQMNLPFGEPPAGPSNLEKQLTTSFSESGLIKLASSFEDKYLLESTASNPVSRFFARLFAFPFGFSDAANLRKARMAMLSAALNAWKKFEKFEIAILSSSKDSIEKASKLLSEAWHSWKQVETALQEAKKLLPKEIENTGGQIQNPNRNQEENKTGKEDKKDKEGNKPAQPNKPAQQTATTNIIDQAKNAADDLESAIDTFTKNNSNLMTSLNNLKEMFVMTEDDATATNFIRHYNSTLKKLNTKYKTDKSSLAEIASEIKKDNLEVVAQAFLNKWLGTVRHSIFPNDSSFLRLTSAKKANSIMKLLDQVMDSLESSLDVEDLESLSKDINKEMSGLMAALRHTKLAK